MLHYKGLIHPEPWITIKPLKDTDMNTTETLGFYDDELPENSCNRIREELQEHYGGDALIHVYYEKDKNYAVIEITKYFNKKDDISKLVFKFKSSFEEYYNETFYEYRI
ncbi:hypothetical protein [Methanobacterium spitsbergense]|uniref:Uncharacterized protein n=1 Tax=Methanobacterium spitsbergense TaxID=2874285 RepID=A0A8T5UUG0_9EURY|nr:hypothetical protein [Methanobacterium spitsbergense]MBZ2165847.1 hypothetical protein [Methanobacterium spitsbergense]